MASSCREHVEAHVAKRGESTDSPAAKVRTYRAADGRLRFRDVEISLAEVATLHGATSSRRATHPVGRLCTSCFHLAFNGPGADRGPRT
jgi:hypothetical protein